MMTNIALEQAKAEALHSHLCWCQEPTAHVTFTGGDCDQDFVRLKESIRLEQSPQSKLDRSILMLAFCPKPAQHRQDALHPTTT